MSDGDVHAELREEADRWSAEHAEMKPPPAPTSPPAAAAPSDKSPASSSPTSDKRPGEASDNASSSSSASDKPPATLSAAAQKSRAEMAEKLATFAWGVLDVFVPKYLGARMKLEADEKAELVRVTAPVIEKRLPVELDGEEISEEHILLATAAIIYGPKYVSPEPEWKKEPTPPGGDPAKPEAPAPTTTTTATVDGKKVEAQVMA